MSDRARTKASAWPAKRLGDLFRINGDQVVPMASPKAEFVHYSIPAWDATGGPAIELGSQIESNKTAVSGRAVLVSKLNPRKPRTVAVLNPAERTCCSTEFICYQPKQLTEDLGFWAAYFASNDFSARLARVAVGSTNSHTRASPKETLKWLVPGVSSVEQHKISQVLDTLDIAIHETEAIIAKLKAVKQGLLHDLLTRGIDANGDLRPPQSEAPHLYKLSPLGWIPQKWESCQVGSVLTQIDAGKSPDCQDIPASGDQWGVLKVGAVHPDGLKLHENKVVELESLRNSAYLVRDGDLLLSRANTYELVGLVCHVTNRPKNLMLSDKTLRLRLNSTRMTTRFLFWQLQHPKARTQIEISANGTSGSMKNISQCGVEQIRITRPPIDEQYEISSQIDAVAQRCQLELNAHLKLNNLKSGLMDDLLTGRVRVTPLLEAAAP